MEGVQKIGENSWVAPGSSVRDWIEIGNNVLVGLGAVVTKNIEANLAVVGNPANQLQKQVIDIEVNKILNGNSLTKKNILIIAAHPDDEVLGLGGTILYQKNGDNISVIFMSDGVTGRDFHYNRKKREEEISQRKLMSKMAFEYYGGHHIDFLDLPNLRMDQEPILKLTKLIEKKIVIKTIYYIYS